MNGPGPWGYFAVIGDRSKTGLKIASKPILSRSIMHFILAERSRVIRPAV
jgi:hypothetical protein